MLENKFVEEPENQTILEEPIIENKYAKNHSIFAVISLILGFLFIKFVLTSSLGISTTIFVFICGVASISFFIINKVKLDKTSIIYLSVILIFSINFTLSSNSLINFLNIIFIMISFTYWAYVTNNNRYHNKINELLIFDLIKSILIMPFSSFSSGPEAIMNTTKKTKFGKNLLLVIVGLIIAIPITGIVTALLFSADQAFSSLFSKLFENIFKDGFIYVFQFAFGIPVAFYIFGVWYSSLKNKNSNILTNDQYNMTIKKVKIAPTALIYAAITPICLIYILFFVSQSSYFLSAFSNIRPENMTFAEYARKGFFELCVVSIINIGIILLMLLFAKQKEDKKSKTLNGYIVVLSISTIILITTALSKMVMYINAYGLTQLRVYTTWFMCLLSIIFILILIKQFYKKFNVLRISVVSFLILFALLSFSDVDGLIAKYNIEGYQNGTYKTLDIEMMNSLSDSAIQYVLPLTKNKDEKIADSAKTYLNLKAFELMGVKTNNWKNYNLSTSKAIKLLKENNIKYTPSNDGSEYNMR